MLLHQNSILLQDLSVGIHLTQESLGERVLPWKKKQKPWGGQETTLVEVASFELLVTHCNQGKRTGGRKKKAFL